MPAKARLHYTGTYKRRARLVRAMARADPSTRCWRCGRTLADHPPHHDGRPVFWTAGHVIDGLPSSLLAAEASTCNLSAGATMGNRKRVNRLPVFTSSRRW